MRKFQKLLQKARIYSDIHSITSLCASGNNRTYRISTASETFLAKEYFHQNFDGRDRLSTEFSFLKYANHIAPDWVPKAYAFDLENNLGLFEFIYGETVKPSEVVDKFVLKAAQFFATLNSVHGRNSADLPIASEACFSINDHLSLISDRLANLLEIKSNSLVNIEAIELVKKITMKWQGIKDIICRNALDFGLDTSEVLPMEYRCVSPSDFGFHNALLQGEVLKFIDFEYAGWDDPAKMVGDFFSQIAVPVSEKYIDEFISKSFSCYEDPDSLIYRSRLLRPAYQIKWCCIALNIFIPVNFERRKFANPGLDEALIKQVQITKAAEVLQKIGG